MRLVLLREIPEDENLHRQWNALVDRMEEPQVFYTYEWALAVYRAYHATLLPLLFLAYDESDCLCGVAALATDPSGREVSFLCATTGDYCDFLSSAEDRGAFVSKVFAEIRKLGIGVVALANLPADSAATVSAIGAVAREHNFYCFVRTAYECSQVVVSSLERQGGDKPVVPRKKMLRRFVNAMGRDAPVRLDHASQWGDLEPALPEFARAHVVRFLVTGRISNLARHERRVFIEELTRLLSGAGWLALTRMMVGPKAVAWNYGFQFHGSWFWYQPTFDSDFEKYSPGHCLLAKMIEEASESERLQIVDLGLGAEDYKERFANRTRETLHVTLQTSLVRHLGTIARFRAAAVVKTSPQLEARIRSLIGKLQHLRKSARDRGVAGTLFWLMGKLRDMVWSRTEVLFYEGSRPSPSHTGSHTGEWELQALTLKQLAAATEKYIEDDPTLAYILRSAQRSREGSAQGFVLVDAEDKPVHFAWTTAFEGFYLAELNAKVEAPSPDAVMLFDCWTPESMRGRGLYARAIGLIADRVRNAGKRPWIFSAAANTASIRGIEKAGFQRRYSLTREKILNQQRIVGQAPASREAAPAEVAAGR